MSTPPSWAYPYATVWDDFDRLALAVLPAPLDVSSSGASWIQEGVRSGLNSGLTTDERASGALFPPVYAGLSHGGRVGLGGPRPLTADEIAGSGDATPFGSAGLAVPGATSTSAYVRSQVFIDTTSSDQYVFLADEGVVQDGTANGFLMYLDGSSVMTLTEFHSDLSTTSLLSVDIGALAGGWHTVEIRLDGAAVTAAMDGAVFGSASLTLSLSAIFAGWYGSEDVTSVPPFVSFWDNFEAGPLALSPLPVPVLRAAPGPTSLRFESPRPN